MIQKQNLLCCVLSSNFTILSNYYRPSDPPIRPSRILPSRMKTDREDNIMMIEEASTSSCDFRSKPLLPASSIKNQNCSEFPDDDFDFDDCDIIEIEGSRRFPIFAFFSVSFLIYIYYLLFRVIFQSTRWKSFKR